MSMTIMDYYEGALLRKTVLVRNALRRASDEGTADEAESLFSGRRRLPRASADKPQRHPADLDDDEEDDVYVAHDAPQVDVSDYDYESSSDESTVDSFSESEADTKTAAAVVVRGEHDWFEDLFDEVSVEQGGAQATMKTMTIDEMDAHSIQRQKSPVPSLTDDDDDGSSTDEEEDELSDDHPSPPSYQGGLDLCTVPSRETSHKKYLPVPFVRKSHLAPANFSPSRRMSVY